MSMQNPVKQIINAIPEADLKTAIAELYELGETGVLTDGIVRNIARSLTDNLGITYTNAIEVVTKGVVYRAAFSWADLEYLA